MTLAQLSPQQTRTQDADLVTTFTLLTYQAGFPSPGG